MRARAWLDLVLDPGWSRRFANVVASDRLGFPGYPEQLAAAKAATGETESVVVALGAIEGLDVVAVSFEFGFLGGSMGAAAGERVARAFELAARRRAPLVALTASGGARMQEGMLALAQMPATIAARAKLAKAGQPFIAYLRNPTTGGVYASFATSADVLWAEPKATIGFAGPRVAELVTGVPLAEGEHTAESAFEESLLDEIVAPEQLKQRTAAVLRLVRAEKPVVASRPAGEESEISSWDAVQRARNAQRRTGVDHVRFDAELRRGGHAHVELLGGGRAHVVRAGLAQIGGTTVIAIAHDRRAGTGRPEPADYRRARRAIATAERLGLPVVTFVDMPGAEPGARAERDGIAHEISATFDAMLEAKTKTVACVVGEGGSGGALAFAACDRVLIQRDAIFSVIAPEGAASILGRADVENVANDLKLTASDLERHGLADLVVGESPNDVKAAIAWALGDIEDSTARAKRWRTWR